MVVSKLQGMFVSELSSAKLVRTADRNNNEGVQCELFVAASEKECRLLGKKEKQKKLIARVEKSR